MNIAYSALFTQLESSLTTAITAYLPDVATVLGALIALGLGFKLVRKAVRL